MIFKLNNYYKGLRNRKGERGNVLFLILIAVALFAALSYAVTQTTRSSGGGATGEVELISSAQLTQYPAGIRTSVIRMIIGGVDVSELFFDPPSDWTANLTTLPLQQRAVFHPNGGGATFQIPPGELIIGGETTGDGFWHFNSNFEIDNLGLDGAGGSELTAFLPGISAGVCGRINEELGLGTAPIPFGSDVESEYETIIASAALGNSPVYTQTTFQDTANVLVAAWPNALAGQPFGCFANDAPNAENVYYHVLIER